MEKKRDSIHLKPEFFLFVTLLINVLCYTKIMLDCTQIESCIAIDKTMELFKQTVLNDFQDDWALDKWAPGQMGTGQISTGQMGMGQIGTTTMGTRQMGTR